ncbi:thioredoxin [Actinomadura parmotrematis]|uniref:Thioredoxin n=1 Tax=Actinomadura parmotrematis TaxID=2864039 RepID=A0ABS7FW21_9ACTN|nr:thioredoxin [Actinomadura parmotrematis]MBW8484619.1 thioredoxin [Actinomadura parmotrematis]
MSSTTTVTDATFDAEVLASETPVLVDFWAEWCGPCKMIAPVLDQIAAEQDGKLKIVKMDYDANPLTPGKYGVLGLPTLLLYKGGEVVEQITGAKPKRALLKAIEPHL